MGGGSGGGGRWSLLEAEEVGDAVGHRRGAHCVLGARALGNGDPWGNALVPVAGRNKDWKKRGPKNRHLPWELGTVSVGWLAYPSPSSREPERNSQRS